jgi:RHS repeat-associated protein
VTIDSFAYTHDALGRRTTLTDLAGSHTYQYDNTYQLTQATHPVPPTEQFSYDPVGNRLGTLVDLNNALLEDSEFLYTYDYNDNLVQKVKKANGEITNFTYDFENRLTRVQYPGMDAQYKYDALGRRIEKNVNGQVTTFVYDGLNMVADYTGLWTVRSKYVFGLDIDEPLSVDQGGSLYYYHGDGLGSVNELTDVSGNTVKTYRYDSFGKITAQTGTLDQPFAFTGREYDSETGLYYYRARYYDPKVGRFISKDPIGFWGGDVNLFRYVWNDPINWVDPEGLAPNPSPKFTPPTNPPQYPPKEVPPGWRIRPMPPTTQYPNGYWKLEKPLPNGSWQPIDPSTMKPGNRPGTHIPFPAPEIPWWQRLMPLLKFPILWLPGYEKVIYPQCDPV